MKSAASLDLTVSADAPGGSGITVTVTRDGQDAGTVQNSSYTVTAAGTYLFTATYGEPITLTARASHAAGDAVRYSYAWYKGTEELAGETGSTLELTDVGTSGAYTVTVTVRDTDGLEASDTSDAVTVVIHPATPDYTVPVNLTATYGDVLSSVELPEGWTWENPDALVGSAGGQSRTTIFTPADTANYETVEQRRSP